MNLRAHSQPEFRYRLRALPIIGSPLTHGSEPAARERSQRLGGVWLGSCPQCPVSSWCSVVAWPVGQRRHCSRWRSRAAPLSSQGRTSWRPWSRRCWLLPRWARRGGGVVFASCFVEKVLGVSLVTNVGASMVNCQKNAPLIISLRPAGTVLSSTVHRQTITVRARSAGAPDPCPKEKKRTAGRKIIDTNSPVRARIRRKPVPPRQVGSRSYPLPRPSSTAASL